MTEFDNKFHRIQALMDEHHLDALLLSRVSSFAWATCGAASYVNTAATEGAAALLVTRQNRYLITNNIEAPRLDQEERLSTQGWEFIVPEWHADSNPLAGLVSGLRLGADGALPGALDLSAQLARLRADLTPEEGQRFKSLAQTCSAAMDAAIRAVRPGQTEHQIAALLIKEGQQRGVQVIVALIATDERIFKFRHPLPTAKPLERYAMLVMCGRQAGLVCSLTRLIHFGPLPADVRRKADAVARVDAEMIQFTRPGRSLAEVFEHTRAVYGRVGYAEEWRLHHQGGPAAYEPREYVATPASSDTVKIGQAYAWNPSITGAKSEDTILIGETGNEVISAVPGWPVLPIDVDGKTIMRPDILEIT